MPYIGSEPLSGRLTNRVIVATGGETSVGAPFSPLFVAVYLNGTLLVPSQDYTLSGTSTINFTEALAAGDEVQVQSIEAYNLPDALKATGDTILGDIDNTATGYLQVAQGTTAQRPVSPTAGQLRYNVDTDTYEGGYANGTFAEIGGGTGASGGANNPFVYENDINITANYTLTSGKNGMTAGPVNIADGVTITIPDGSRWVIV